MGTVMEGENLQLKRVDFSDLQNPEMEAAEALSKLRNSLSIIEGQDSETVQQLDDLMTAYKRKEIDSNGYKKRLEILDARMEELSQSHKRITELYGLFRLATTKNDSIN